MSRSIGRTPPLRLVVDNRHVQLALPLHDVVSQALPLARQLQLITEILGADAHRQVADELVHLLESPRRPRRAA